MDITQLINNQGRAVANQFIIDNDNIVSFHSYQSKICDYDKNSKTLKLYKDWNYSATTFKYFQQFLENFTNLEYGTKSEFKKSLDDLVKNGTIELMY